MSARRTRVGDRLLAAVAVVAVAAGLALHETGAVRGIERDLVDARFEIRGTEEPPADVVVVAIDDRTFDDLDVEAWPFPRSVHARLIDAMRRAGADVIAYDVQFTEPTTPEQDGALAAAIARHGKVVLATTETDERGRTAVLGGDAALREIGARAGNANLPPHEGGVLRQLPYEFDGLETFSVQVVAAERGGLPARPDGTRWIDYHGPPGTFAMVSFSSALRASAGDPRFRGKTVVVGATAPSLQDLHQTPTGGDRQMAGAEIQANAISTVRRGFPLRSPPGVISLVLVVLMGVGPPLLARSQSVALSLGLSLMVLAVFLVAAQLAFQDGGVWPVAAPVAAWALGALGTTGARYAATAYDRERIRDVFRRFVPEAVVDNALDQTSGAPRLGGVRLDGTVLFCDLRGFTTFAERREPEVVIDVLNRYLRRMSNAIMARDGTLVSYMGDGIMAVFGAPVPDDHHADQALSAARDMVEALEDFNADLRRSSLHEGFKMGIGLHSGPIMSGNVGSERRLEYTAIGDTTNTAARLEAATKETNQQLLLSEATRLRLSQPPPDLLSLGELDIRGREEPIAVWTLAGTATPRFSTGREPTSRPV